MNKIVRKTPLGYGALLALGILGLLLRFCSDSVEEERGRSASVSGPMKQVVSGTDFNLVCHAADK